MLYRGLPFAAAATAVGGALSIGEGSVVNRMTVDRHGDELEMRGEER